MSVAVSIALGALAVLGLLAASGLLTVLWDIVQAIREEPL